VSGRDDSVRRSAQNPAVPWIVPMEGVVETFRASGDLVGLSDVN
jgi:hypothetical protein